MNVRVTIDLPAEKLSELQALLIGNLPSIYDLEREPVPVPEEPAVVAAPTTAESVAEPKPVAKKPAKTDNKPVERPAEKPVKVTKEMIRARGIEITKAGKQDQLAAVFKQFGAANLRSVKEEDYEAVYEMLGAI